MHFEFIDGNPKDFPEDLTFEGKVDGFTQKFTFEGKNSYIHKADGYHISFNKLGEEFRADDDDGWRFQEKLFIPHTSIKMVREKIEYHVEKQDAFNLIKRHSKPNEAFTYAEIKEKLETNGVKFSEKSLEAILKRLERESKIYKPDPNIEAWITTEAHNRGQSIVMEEKDQELKELALSQNFKIK